MKKGIPMYEIIATASGVEVYNDINDTRPVGRMNFPGIEECDFALPVWGALYVSVFREWLLGGVKDN
jgi:hypothetical protein